MNLSAVPVVYYHSIKYKRKESWVHPYITMTLKSFEKHVNFMNVFRIKTFFMDDLYLHLKGENKLPLNSLIINFDDGYLDNFVFAFPLLKKYKLKATIWVNPEFVDNNDSRIRPNLDDYWNGKYTLQDLNDFDGFINWEEMRLMEKSGFIEIQSHTLSHTKFPVSDEIVDFISPNTKIDWLHWNLFPDDKPCFLTNPKNRIPLGYPVYKSEKGNIAIKYLENGDLTKEIIHYVAQNDDEKFFENENWKETLFRLAEKLKKEHKVSYRKETDEEYILRIKNELLESKKLIEKHLDKKVNHLCWPFGGWNEIAEKLAMKCGYLTTSIRGQKNIFRKKLYNRADRIALDNPKYQDYLFYLFAAYVLLRYKL